MRRRGAAIALLVALCSALAVAPAQADAVQPGGYQVIAQAPVLQWTFDFPTANFHPQAESELTYTEADGDPSRAHALSSVVWPGAAGGNLGSLVGLLAPPGVPAPPTSVLDALNDPVRAEAATGATTQQATTAPGGVAMKASVVPEQSSLAQEASSLTTSAGLSFGPSGSLGASWSAAKHTLDQNGKLVATAQSYVSDVDVAGVFHAGSISASATEQSVGGATPTGSSTITAGDLLIGGQRAYVDGAGVHMGQPGKPAGSAAVAAADQALANAGMEIYFTAPEKIAIAGTTYDYSASILLYWAPPDDSHGDVLTFSFGGAAIGMSTSVGAGSASAGESDQGSGGVEGSSFSAPSSIPVSPAGSLLQLPAGTSATSGAPAAAPAPAGPASLAPGQLASAKGPLGIGGWWLVLLAIAALVGIALLPRLPGLLTSAATPECVLERPTPTRRL